MTKPKTTRAETDHAETSRPSSGSGPLRSDLLLAGTHLAVTMLSCAFLTSGVLG